MDGNEYLYDFKKRSDESALVCLDPSKTVQSDAVDADINVIVARFNITGQMPQALHLPTYEDYDGVFDFRTAQDALVDAEAQFMSIPANIRAQFDNDPAVFLDYASDPANFDGLVTLGLAKPKEVVTEVPPVVVDNPA